MIHFFFLKHFAWVFFCEQSVATGLGNGGTRKKRTKERIRTNTYQQCPEMRSLLRTRTGTKMTLKTQEVNGKSSRKEDARGFGA